MNVTEFSDYRGFLEWEYGRRSESNPSYSLRSFARDLDIFPSLLSDVMKKKKNLSLSTAARIGESLGLSESEKFFLCDLALLDHVDEGIRKMVSSRLTREKQRVQKPPQQMKQVEIQTVMAKWYHFALLELFDLEDFQSAESWIATQLDLSIPQVQVAIESLIKVQMIERSDSGELIRLRNSLTSTVDVPSQVIRDYHQQVLSKAKSALETQALNVRDFSSITVACDSELVGKAKEKIKKFRRSLLHFLESESSRKDSVYCAQIGFFRLSSHPKTRS